MGTGKVGGSLFPADQESIESGTDSPPSYYLAVCNNRARFSNFVEV